MSTTTVIFDLFNTLVDLISYDKTDAISMAKRAYFQHVPDDVFCSLFSRYETERVNTRSITLEECPYTAQMRYVAENTGTDLEGELEEMERSMFSGFIMTELGKGTVDILDYLHGKGYRLAVCSNSRFSSACLRGLLDGYGILDRFEAVISSTDTGHRKPSPLMYSDVCSRLKISPGEACFVGDDFVKDADGPRSFGMDAVHYLRDGSRRRDGKTVTSLSQLKQIL